MKLITLETVYDIWYKLQRGTYCYYNWIDIPLKYDVINNMFHEAMAENNFGMFVDSFKIAHYGIL